jgi:hypothetical protein
MARSSSIIQLTATPRERMSIRLIFELMHYPLAHVFGRFNGAADFEDKIGPPRECGITPDGPRQRGRNQTGSISARDRSTGLWGP